MNMIANHGDEIHIHGLHCRSYCGIYGEERRQWQDLLIDVQLDLERGMQILRQTIQDTVDYTAVARFVAQALDDEEFHLIENIAETLCLGILSNFPPVQKVTTSVRKKPAPWVDSVENFTAEFSLCRFVGALGMGTNVGDDLFKNLDEARGYIGKIPHTRILKKSSIHQTVPLLMVDQRDFLNQCLLIETWLHPEQFLQHTQRIERDMGRVPTAVNGPRIIDIDLLAFNGFTSVGPFLVLPHPALNSRRFLIDELGELGIKIWPKDGSVWGQKCEKVQ